MALDKSFFINFSLLYETRKKSYIISNSLFYFSGRCSSLKNSNNINNIKIHILAIFTPC